MAHDGQYHGLPCCFCLPSNRFAFTLILPATMLYIERVTYDLGREMLRACAPI